MSEGLPPIPRHDGLRPGPPIVTRIGGRRMVLGSDRDVREGETVSAWCAAGGRSRRRREVTVRVGRLVYASWAARGRPRVTIRYVAAEIAALDDPEET